MSSEIEVVDEVQQSRDLNTPTNGTTTTTTDEEILKDDVYTAAAYGDLEKLQRLVESEGCSVSQPDSLGYYALQWAALNNRAAAAQYIIQVSGREVLERNSDVRQEMESMKKIDECVGETEPDVDNPVLKAEQDA